ncbi:site-specific integrase [Salicibibacter halophilus]|uniref:Site-specific integrase n=1 Tax=Salicibibacter halophilus TaxID=2502791 RepID=A0A514LMI5_9BACI|nr:site-specific integrase [Salicibibacter halophilus]QDI92481.1 site-specific integrase [Salicibibacter halophilus]
MSIQKRNDGSYRVNVELGIDPITNKRNRITRVAYSKREAIDLERKITNEHKNNTLITENLSFSKVCYAYTEECKIHQKPGTYKILEYNINKHIFPYFKDSLLKKISSEHIREYQKNLIDQGLNNKTINNIMINLSEIFNKALEFEVIKSNPCINVKNLKLNKKEMKFWTPDQFKTFIGLIKDDEFLFKTFYSLAYLTGMRTGEMLALKWNDISTFNREINVYKTLTYIERETIITEPKTKNAIRRININQKLLQLLFEWKEKQQNLFAKLRMNHSNDIYIFQYRENPPSKDIFSRRIRKICERGDVEPIRLHDLRHSHVALLIHQGEDHTTIKERLGHASIKTTIDVYGHLFPNKQKETADRLDDLF